MFVCAAALAAGLPSMAAEPAVADPAAPVPPPTYRSVFAPPAGLPAAQPPDWKRANAEVAQFPRGHADLLRWEQAQPAAEGPPQTPDRRHQMSPLLRDEPARMQHQHH